MARDRSGDIARVKRDLSRISEAESVVSNMFGTNKKLSEDLNELGDEYVFSANIPQDDFKMKLLELNHNVDPSLVTINEKLAAFTEKLLDKLRRYEEEQKQWEAEQAAANDNSTSG